MSEKLVLSSTSVRNQFSLLKENSSEVVLSQGRRKPPLPQLIVVAKVQ